MTAAAIVYLLLAGTAFGLILTGVIVVACCIGCARYEQRIADVGDAPAAMLRHPANAAAQRHQDIAVCERLYAQNWGTNQ